MQFTTLRRFCRALNLFWVAYFLLFLPKGVASSLDATPVVFDDTIEAYRQLFYAIKVRQPDSRAIRLGDATTESLPCSPATVLIAIGRSALDRLFVQCPNSPILATYVTESSLTELPAIHPPIAWVPRVAPLERQLNLASNMLRTGAKIAIIYSPSLSEVVAKAMNTQSIPQKLISVPVVDSYALGITIKPYLREVDAIVIADDANLLTSYNFEPLVLSTSRNNVALFGGPSPAFVKSGLAGGVYVLDNAVVDTIVNFVHSPKFGAPNYVTRLTPPTTNETNSSVLRALRLPARK